MTGFPGRYSLLLALCALRLFAQNPNSPVYPNAIAGDNNLLVASDNGVTTLSAAVTSTQTTIPLLNSANFIAPTGLVVGSEKILCLTLSSGVYSNCTRGWQGTVAQAYAAGTQVYEPALSYIHNQEAAEIKAIETALGANFSGGGVSSHGSNYTLQASDNATLVVFNGASITATLPNPVPSAQWTVTVLNINSSALTVSPNGLNADGSTGNLTLNQYQSVKFWTDGSNYWYGSAPSSSSSLFTSYQFGTQTPLTGSLLYLQTLYPGVFSLSQSGAGTSGNPIVDIINLAPESANCVMAGPASGSAAAWGCRSLLTADLPSNIPLSQLAQISNNTILGNFSGSSANAAPYALQTIMDTVLCNTPGAIIYRSGSAWGCLGPGTAGSVLQTQGPGPGANPLWAPPFSLTTAGSSGPATFMSGTLNIPQYSGSNPTSNGVANWTGSGWGTSYTSATLTGFLNLFTGTTQGLVPASGGNANTFLTGAGSFTAPFSLTTTGTNCTGASFGSGTLNIPPCNPSSATLAFQLSGVSQGSYGTLNFQNGNGIIWACSSASGVFSCAPSYNPALIPTHTTIHANENYCSSTNGTTAYTCSLAATQALSAYSVGMSLTLVVDNPCSSTCSLNVDTVGGVSIETATGGAPNGALVANEPVTVTLGPPGCTVGSTCVFLLPPSSGGNGITQITGDVVAGPGSGSQGATVTGVNGAQVPASLNGLATNSSKQLVAQSYSNIVAEFNSGTCAGYLKSDGTCSLPSTGGLTQSPLKFSLSIRPVVPLGLSTSSPVTVQNTMTATTLIGKAFLGSAILPAGYMIGHSYRIMMSGLYGTASSLPTLTITIVLGGVTIATITPTLVSSASGNGWSLQYTFTIASLTAVNGSGCMSVQGTSSALNSGCAGGATSGLNFGTSQTLDVQVAWSAASASNTITSYNAIVREL